MRKDFNTSVGREYAATEKHFSLKYLFVREKYGRVWDHWDLIGITGLRENFGQDSGIEEPYWGPSLSLILLQIFIVSSFLVTHFFFFFHSAPKEGFYFKMI